MPLNIQGEMPDYDDFGLPRLYGDNNRKQMKDDRMAERHLNMSAVDRLKKQRTNSRSWQLMMVGNTEEPIDINAEAINALTQILDLSPHLGGVTIQTAKGSLRVSRDYPSDTPKRVDALIAAVFRNDPQITGIEFPDHTATPDDPYYSSDGKAAAAIETALKTKEIAPAEAIRRLNTLRSKDQDHGA